MYPPTLGKPASTLYGPTPPPPIAPSPTSSFGNPATFTAAANTQGSDYDRIMASYADLVKQFSTNPITAGRITAPKIATPQQISPSFVTPQTTPFKQSSDVTGSLSKLSDLATTGGYSPEGIRDIRERSISPIRSIYANAQQNVERQKALAGGYSPNYGAVTASMARDEASKIGDITTGVNAGIAQNVASNKIAAAAPYASASEAANAAETAANQKNTDIINQINSFNAGNSLQSAEFNASTAADIAKANAQSELQSGEFNSGIQLNADLANRQGALSAIQGQASLYGTTPALVNTFGNQVSQAAQLGQNQQEINNRNILGGIGLAGNMARPTLGR